MSWVVIRKYTGRTEDGFFIVKLEVVNDRSVVLTVVGDIPEISINPAPELELDPLYVTVSKGW